MQSISLHYKFPIFIVSLILILYFTSIISIADYHPIRKRNFFKKTEFPKNTLHTNKIEKSLSSYRIKFQLKKDNGKLAWLNYSEPNFSHSQIDAIQDELKEILNKVEILNLNSL